MKLFVVDGKVGYAGREITGIEVTFEARA